MSARPTIRLARGEQFRQPEETLSGGAVHQGGCDERPDSTK